MKRTLILCMAILGGYACAAYALGDTVTGDTVTIVKGHRAVVTATCPNGDCHGVDVPVKVRYARPVRFAVPATKAEFVAEHLVPRYKITEQLRDPWVWRGLFRDRVVVPHRSALSIEKLD